MREYWGGMLEEGATSFWEAYDPAWPKENPHASLQADRKRGYYVSLAHGWSSGPALWMMDHLAGITQSSADQRLYRIAPWRGGQAPFEGSVRTHTGALRVRVTQASGWRVHVELPEGVRAEFVAPEGMKIRARDEREPKRMLSGKDDSYPIGPGGSYEFSEQ